METRYEISPVDAVLIGGAAADVLIRSGDGKAALVYLALLRSGGDTARALKMLSLPQEEAAGALQRLGALGLIRSAGAAPDAKGAPERDELPQYSLEDVKHELAQGSQFAALVSEVQKVLGKILTSDDLVRLFGIYDYLGLPPDVIFQLVAFCVDEHRRRYGEGRKPTVRYIEKVAYSWEREGIRTLEDAERHIARLERRRDKMNEILAILQIRDRAPSATERRVIEDWLELGVAPELVEMAYDKTLVQTGRLNWKYIDAILKSWHAAGYRTAQDVIRGEGRPEDKKAAPGRGAKPGAGQPEVPDKRDIERMKKLLQTLKGE